ncbi:MAG: hypothetical protein QNK22_03550 [Xanthomonadales bacterium]|nr:hypothetical protein [Xanthomonadales bacterium]
MQGIIKVLTVAILLQATPSQAASVIKDGNEWLQPADFVDISWQQIDAICPATSDRVCTGSLGGIDITGFIFASIEEVNMLMATYGVPQPDLCGGSAARVEDSAWAPAAFADFSPTEEFDGNRYLEANVSDANICDAIIDPFCDFEQNGFIGIQSDVDFGDSYCAGPGSIPIGAWLYRPYSPAPVAITTLSNYGLLLAIFGMLLAASRRFSVRKAKQG